MKRVIALAIAAGLMLGGTAAFACNSKDQCIAQGKKAYIAKDYEKAKEFFKKAIQFDPKCEKAWKYYDRALKKMIMKEVGEEEGC